MKELLDEPWTIALLGGLRVQRGEQSITRFMSSKTGALLGYLAFHLQQIHSREALLELFWPGSPSPEAARNSLSVALSSLRHQLEPPGTPTGAVLRADRYSIGLNPAAVTTDVQLFKAAIQQAGATSKTSGSTTEQVQLLSHAVALYQGRLLPSYYDAWITPEQERLDGLFLLAIRQLIDHLRQAGDSVGALSYARRAISIDPFQEDAHADLMRLLHATGQPGAALRQYKELERLLEEEIGEEPSAPLRALYRQIEKETGLNLPPVAAIIHTTTHTAPPLHPLAASVTPSADAAAAGTSPPLPDTVTFLMTELLKDTTDTTGSTAEHKNVLPAYHALLRREFTRLGGQEVKEAGSSFLVAFGSARKALDCAVAAQQALQEIGLVWVRIALHTGDVEYKEGAYQGPALLCLSRMLTAAHGGQVLLSEVTAGLVRRDPGDDVRLVDLGVYWLREVPVPERLFQADYPGMPQAAFPPLAAAAGHAAHLPLRFTRFFGRETEIETLTEMLTDPPTRLVTITGSGGTGKTRLALQVAEQRVEPLAGAVYFVPLAEITDPALIAGAILDALRLPRSPQREPLEQAIDALNKQPSLLLLDNFEQLVEKGGPEVVQTLLERVPGLTILVTSRQVLGLSAEREFVLSPLQTPNGDEGLERLSLFDSVALFIDRAQQVKPEFQVTSRNAAALAELVHRLEGIPLAIELAASRAQVLTPAQMLAQLSHRFEFLTSRKRWVSERQRTLKGAVDWSYQLLSPELQRFFCRLSVFRGGWTIEAAEAICEEPEHGRAVSDEHGSAVSDEHGSAVSDERDGAVSGLALDYLAQLRECSLVLSDETEQDGISQMRFHMLETLREFGAECLDASGETAALRNRHLDYYCDPQRQGTPEPTHVLSKMAASVGGSAYRADLDGGNYMRQELPPSPQDDENYQSALAWAVESDNSRGIVLALRLFWLLWVNTGRLADGYTWFVRLQELSVCAGRTPERAVVLDSAAFFAKARGDVRLACDLFEEVLSIYRELENKVEIVDTLYWLSSSKAGLGELGSARAYIEESIQICREYGGLVAGQYQILAQFAVAEGDFATARDWLAKAKVEDSSEDARAFIDWGLAKVLLAEGDLAGAQAALESVRPLFQGAQSALARLDIDLGEVALRRGDLPGASLLLTTTLGIIAEHQTETLIQRGLFLLAEVEATRQPARAARLFGAATAPAKDRSGILSRGHGEATDRAIASLRSGMEEAAFAAAWEAGQMMTREQAVAYALATANTGEPVEQDL